MRPFAIALTAAVFAATAFAAEPPQRVQGSIGSYDAKTHVLSVKTIAGTTVAVTLAPDAKIIANEKSSLADIKPGDFVASAAMKEKDGKLHSEELRIFPELLRGAGEGQYPMQKPGQSMTNATVEQVNGATVAASSGTLKLSFHGSTKSGNGSCTGHASAPGKGTCTGQTELIVGPNVPVTRWVLGDTSWLEPGKVMWLFAAKGGDGKLTSSFVVVEHNGIKPIL